MKPLRRTLTQISVGICSITVKYISSGVVRTDTVIWLPLPSIQFNINLQEYTAFGQAPRTDALGASVRSLAAPCSMGLGQLGRVRPPPAPRSSASCSRFAPQRSSPADY